MIASVWRVVIPENEILHFIRHCEKDVLPKYNGTPGLLYVWLWSRPCIGYADIQVVSIWHSADDIKADLLKDIKENQDYIIVPDQAATRYQVVSLLAAAGPKLE